MVVIRSLPNSSTTRHRDLIGEFVWHVLAEKASVEINPRTEEDDIPSQLLKFVTSAISDLFVGRTHLDRVDLALTELSLNGIQTCNNSDQHAIQGFVLVADGWH